MDLDYALWVDTPAALTAESSTVQKADYEKWERSNRISLLIMKGSITAAIRGAIPDPDNANVREHILRMNDMASQLKGLDMEIFEGFLVHFIMTSLPVQFDPFKINYNTQKKKWKMSELISILDAYGYSLKFENKGFSIFFYSRVIGSGLLEGNLYKLPLNASFTESLKTMSANDVVAKTYGYPEMSKSFRFYCPSHTTRIVETRRALFFEDAEYIESSTPRILNLEEIHDHVFIHVIQKVGAPLPHIEDNDASEVVPNDVPPIMDPAEIPTNEQPLRKSGRERRTYISIDYIV
ncbi:hypothetical protein RJ640_029237 [Escallonia rubra]|uniref:Uncharacterized protein n=1 Tax=Escallonia rubra TaxID=112253 RepID=A0AA88QD36_9ASTE|nr:hypothetical protein RJ640_029237 [Escallonia rubra]